MQFTRIFLSTYCVLLPSLYPGLFPMQPGRGSGFVFIRGCLRCIVGRVQGTCWA